MTITIDGVHHEAAWLASAAVVAGPLAHYAVERFAASLAGIVIWGGNIDTALEAIPLPHGALHVRLFDGETDELVAEINNAGGSTALNAFDVADAMIYHFNYFDKLWVRTSVRDQEHPGVLDLSIWMERMADAA